MKFNEFGRGNQTTLLLLHGMCSTCPTVKLRVFPGCGHGTLLTQPERLLEEIRNTHIKTE